MMTMVACLVYDLALFSIFSVNIMYSENSGLVTTELSFFISCFIFGILFEFVGRKRIFTMRLCVTCIASIFVPYINQIPVWII